MIYFVKNVQYANECCLTLIFIVPTSTDCIMKIKKNKLSK